MHVKREFPHADRTELYIGGRWTPAAGGASLDVVDPAREQVVATIPDGTAADVERAVRAAAEAREPWAAVPVEERAQLLERIGAGLTERAEEIAQTITGEMGSPITLSRTLQAVLPAGTFARAAQVLREHQPEHQLDRALVVHEPIGVVAAITPWNFPLHQVALKVAYALAAGCPVVLKPSEVAPLDAFVLAEVAEAAGLPAGVLNLVTGTGPTVGEALAGHRDVDLISLTGSTRAGRAVLGAAAGTIKRVALELGGKSANLILDDADLPAAVRHGVDSAFLNTGQRCDGLTRLLVPRARLAEAEEVAAAAVASYAVGDPQDPATTLGPLANGRQRDQVVALVDQAVRDGARPIVLDQRPHDGPGFYVSPAAFSVDDPRTAIAREEIFGPVVVLIPHDGDDHAVRIANDTEYGLNNGVWSSDPQRAERVARRLRSGQVEINGAAPNPLAPFGGYKQSGLGREAGSYGLAEFFEVKAIQR